MKCVFVYLDTVLPLNLYKLRLQYKNYHQKFYFREFQMGEKSEYVQERQ